MNQVCDVCKKELIHIGPANKCFGCLCIKPSILNIWKKGQCGLWNGAQTVFRKITLKDPKIPVKLHDILEEYSMWILLKKQKTIDEFFPKDYKTPISRNTVFNVYHTMASIHCFEELRELILKSGPTEIYKETSGWDPKKQCWTYIDEEVDSLWNHIKAEDGFQKGVAFRNISHPYIYSENACNYILYKNNKHEYYLLHFY
jgi:hypothetical protein